MKTRTVFVIFLFVTLLLYCSVDHGIAPLPGMLKVKVVFRGTPPANTEGIYLIVAPQFPPHAINELFHSPNSLPIDQDTVETQMALPYGSYDAMSLWWYNKETKSNLADVLSLPLDIHNQLLPLGFELTPEQPVFEYTMHANWNRVDRDASIEGTIYFNGPYPKNTLATAIAAYKYEPQANVHYLVFLKSMDFTVEGNPYKYKLPMSSGSVGYIAVFWLPERAALTDFRILGIYENPDFPGVPKTLMLKENEVRRGIDIHADWSVIDQTVEGENE